MKKTIEILNKLKAENLINDYAIGGAMAALKWVEPFFTRDLDIFIELIQETRENEIIDLSPIYDYLRKMGYFEWTGQWIIIEDIPVEFIPAVGISKEALDNAVNTEFDNVRTRIMTPEYLVALCLNAGRSKDMMKIRLLLEQADIDIEKLKIIINKYSLTDKFESFR